MDEIKDIDPEFNEAMFITKVNNIFVMLYSAIMMDDLDRVRHYLSASLEEKYDALLKDLNSRNVRQMYDELNVKTTTITFIKIKDDILELHVDLVSRYMDYLVDKDTGNYISGDNEERIEKLNHLILNKKIGATYEESARKCPSCGANINVNASGKCPYCGSIFDAENHDWILTSLSSVEV